MQTFVLKSSNIQKFEKYPNFEFLKFDIRNIDECKQAVSNIDIVFHEAALGSVPRSINDPIITNEVNVSGFLNMLVAARDGDVKRFIYAASSSTYGDSKEMPKVEDRIGKPLSPYAVTKYVNELYADVFAKTYGFESIGLRYFNVFGRKQNPNGAYAAVIPKFVLQMMHHQPVIIHGDGEYSRDFTYIDNVVQANILGLTVPGIKHQVFNVATGKDQTVLYLVKAINKILGKNIGPKLLPVRAGDVFRTSADISKIKKILKFNPTVKFEDGLKKTIDWFRK